MFNTSVYLAISGTTRTREQTIQTQEKTKHSCGEPGPDSLPSYGTRSHLIITSRHLEPDITQIVRRPQRISKDDMDNI